jgi:DNA-binding FadR family transcriptional regulator
MTGLYNSIERPSLVESVIDTIIKLLEERKLNVGDRIPKERELAAFFKVSRTVIRQALMQLNMMGLISGNTNDGCLITRPDLISDLSRRMNPSILSHDTLKEIFEIRLAIEIGIADLICNRVSVKDIKDLRRIVQREPANTATHIFEASYEIIFHGRLHKISGNKIIHNFQHLLLPIFDHVEKSSLYATVKSPGKFVSHSMLIDILEQGDPVKFRNAMRIHLEIHFKKLLSNSLL